MAMAVLSLNRTDVANIYNAAIADWQYRQVTTAKQLQIHDLMSWRFLAALVLKQQAKISHSDQFVIAVLTAMQQGKLLIKPEFISH